MASRSASFIDLTQEPDSPEVQPRTAASSRRGQRQQPGQQSGHPVQVIDLTEIIDDDDDETITISGSRTLPGPAWSPFGGANAGDGDSGSGAAHNASSRSRSMLGFANALGAGSLEGLARFTNYALDSIPSLGSSGGGSGSGHDAHSGRPQGIGSRRRPTRQAAASSSRRAAGFGVAGGDGGSSGVRGNDVFFGAASLGSLLDPLGGNQPDLNYESNGYFNLRQHIHQQYRHHLQPQFAAQNVARVHQLHGRTVYALPHPMSVNLNFGAGGAAAMADPDKPPYVAPADPPSGFTRSTGEDLVAVCVSCDEELAYDDSSQGNDAGKEGEPAPKRKQSRKEREEHPFWAVTGCGHVYCRRCFDNRRNVLKGTRLPAVEFKTDGRLVYCAADGCTVDVTPKKAWVGLFA